jgi:hypothetical protein
MIAWWFALPEPVRKALMWIGAILGVILLGKAYVASERGKARKDERAKNTAANEKEHARTVETAHEIIEETHAKADEAREAAASLPEYSSADELRERDPALAKIVFGHRDGNGS